MGSEMCIRDRFYNYIVAKIDSIVNDMEDASITLIDILSAQKK